MLMLVPALQLARRVVPLLRARLVTRLRLATALAFALLEQHVVVPEFARRVARTPFVAHVPQRC